MAGAYETKQYRNVFAEYGYSEEEIEKRVQYQYITFFNNRCTNDTPILY